MHKVTASGEGADHPTYRRGFPAQDDDCGMAAGREDRVTVCRCDICASRTSEKNGNGSRHRRLGTCWQYEDLWPDDIQNQRSIWEARLRELPCVVGEEVREFCCGHDTVYCTDNERVVLGDCY